MHLGVVGVVEEEYHQKNIVYWYEILHELIEMLYEKYPLPTLGMKLYLTQ